jgi:hypothetical protein
VDATKPHLLYLPHPGLAKESMVSRGVSLLLSLREFNISVRMQGEQSKTELAGMVNVCLEKVVAQLPFLTAQLDALWRGLPILKTMKVKEEEPQENEQTSQDIRSGKQSVLKAVSGIPQSRVVPQPPKVPRKTASNTRASSSTDAVTAADIERATQDKALEKAKRKRDEDLAKAAAHAPPPKRKIAGKPIPKSKEKNQTVDLGLSLGGVADDVPE